MIIRAIISYRKKIPAKEFMNMKRHYLKKTSRIICSLTFVLSFFITANSLFAKEDLVYESPHATHQHVLKEIVTMTDGPIIEFGSGDSSTDLLHALCEKTQRLLITLDDDAKWLNKFKERYLGRGYEKDNSGWHKFFFVPGKKDNLSPDHWIRFFEDSRDLLSIEYAACFVDQSPWLARYETIKRFKNRSKYVLLHDCNYFPEKNIMGTVIKPLDRKRHIEGKFDFCDTFAFFKVYYPKHPWPGDTGPPTLVGSMFENAFPNFEERP